MRLHNRGNIRTFALCLALAFVGSAQTPDPTPAADSQKPADQTPAAPAAPATLPTPAIVGPLSESHHSSSTQGPSARSP